jgi:hypothetical protein
VDGRRALTKHSEVKFEELGCFDIKAPEIGVLRIQQDIPFAANSGRGHVQRHCLACANPTIAVCPERFISQLVPPARKGLQIKTPASESVGNFRFDRNQVVGLQIRFEVNEGLERGQGQRR